MSSLRSLCERLVLAAYGLLAFSGAHADWQLTLPPGVTEISRQIYDLHMLIFWVCVVIGVLVFAAMAYALVAFRKKDGVEPATWDHSTAAEIIWTVVPVLILVAMAIPTARTLVFIEDTRGTEMTVKITGYQWKCNYEYVDQGVSFYSNLARPSNVARQMNSGIDPFSVENYLLEVDRPLVLPAGVKIRYVLTSGDVNHAWWVQAFGVKRDAIPVPRHPDQPKDPGPRRILSPPGRKKGCAFAHPQPQQRDKPVKSPTDIHVTPARINHRQNRRHRHYRHTSPP